MAQSKSGGNPGSKQSDQTQAQTDAGSGGKTSKSSRNNKANVKAGSIKGAGGGAKQKQGR
jgi:hypothetical protein